MTTPPFRYTPEQTEQLAENDGFIPAAILDDGDLLILGDAGPLGGPYEGTHIAKYLAYVLTRDGQVQGISYHYQHYHDLTAPLGEPHPLEPCPDLESPDRLLITLQAARVYLDDTHDIRVTTRTLRNWCYNGRIASRRFSDEQGAPWYTTVAALDKIAAEWKDGVHVRKPGSADPEPEEAIDGLQ